MQGDGPCAEVFWRTWHSRIRFWVSWVTKLGGRFFCLRGGQGAQCELSKVWCCIMGGIWARTGYSVEQLSTERMTRDLVSLLLARLQFVAWPKRATGHFSPGEPIPYGGMPRTRAGRHSLYGCTGVNLLRGRFGARRCLLLIDKRRHVIFIGD